MRDPPDQFARDGGPGGPEAIARRRRWERPLNDARVQNCCVEPASLASVCLNGAVTIEAQNFDQLRDGDMAWLAASREGRQRFQAAAGQAAESRRRCTGSKSQRLSQRASDGIDMKLPRADRRREGFYDAQCHDPQIGLAARARPASALDIV